MYFPCLHPPMNAMAETAKLHLSILNTTSRSIRWFYKIMLAILWQAMFINAQSATNILLRGIPLTLQKLHLVQFYRGVEGVDDHKAKGRATVSFLYPWLIYNSTTADSFFSSSDSGSQRSA